MLKSQERSHSLFQNLSSLTSSLSPFFHLFFTILGKGGKKWPSEFLEEERKGRIPFQLPFSPFLLVLVWVAFNEELMSYIRQPGAHHFEAPG